MTTAQPTVVQPPTAQPDPSVDPCALSVVVACDNEAEGVAALVSRLSAVCRPLKKLTAAGFYRLIQWLPDVPIPPITGDFRLMSRRALDAITGFSVRPLQLASLAGFGFGLLAAAVLAYAFISWAFFRTVSGWTSLIAVVALLGSVQLFVLGIIGEYLGRLYVQSQGRPLFIIERIEGGPARPEEHAR